MQILIFDCIIFTCLIVLFQSIYAQYDQPPPLVVTTIQSPRSFSSPQQTKLPHPPGVRPGSGYLSDGNKKSKPIEKTPLIHTTQASWTPHTEYFPEELFTTKTKSSAVKSTSYKTISPNKAVTSQYNAGSVRPPISNQPIKEKPHGVQHLVPTSKNGLQNKVVENSRRKIDGSGCIADNLFIIDSTSSVKNIFEQHRDYVEKVIRELDISDQAHHVGVILYASKNKNRVKISLADRQNKNNITEHIQRLPFFSGVTATGAALKLALKELELRRPHIPTNLIVITDGFSYDYVEEPIEELKKISGLRRFAVSIGNSQNKPELEILAGNNENVLYGLNSYGDLLQKLLSCHEERKGGGSELGRGGGGEGNSRSFIRPGHENFLIEPPQGKIHSDSLRKGYQNDHQSGYQLKNGQNRKNANTEAAGQIAGNEVSGYESALGQERLLSKTRENQKTKILPHKECKYDLLLVLDISGSLQDRFERQIQLAENIINTFPIGADQTHIGIIKFSGKNKSFIVLPLNNTLDKTGVRKKLEKIRFIGGTTWTNQALLKALSEITGPGARSNADKLVLLFTDGFSWEDPTPAAKEFQSKGIPIFTIGINHEFPVNVKELENIAGTKERVFLDSDIDSLQNLLNSLTKTCS